MSSRQMHVRIALALLALLLLGANLFLVTRFRKGKESIFDTIRADATAGGIARASLRFTEAESHFRRVLRLLHPAPFGHDENPELEALTLTWLGETLQDEGRLGEARRCFERSVVLSNVNLNRFSEGPIKPLSHLRSLYSAAGDDARAGSYRTEFDSIVTRVEPIHLNAVALDRRLGAGHEKALADELMALAELYYARGEIDRPESLYAEVLSIRSRHIGNTDPSMLPPLLRLGTVSADAAKNRAAERLIRESLKMREAQYGPDSPWLERGLSNLGVVLMRQRHTSEADSVLMRALAIHERCLGRDHPYSVELLGSLAECKLDEGAYRQALEYQERVIAIRKRVFGPTSHMVGAGLLELAKLHDAAGDRIAARRVCEEALAISKKASGAIDPLTFECESALQRLSRSQS